MMRNLYISKKLWLGAVAVAVLALPGCVSAPVVLAGAGGTAAANSAGSSVTMPQQVDDFTIRSHIYTILNNTPNLNGAHVEVTVFNGIVLLLGQVPTQDIMQQIVSQTSALKGVVVVYNQMTVGPNEPLAQYTKDSWVTSKVIAAIAEKVNPIHFKVVTQNGVVYILGQVTHKEADMAVQQASHVQGVKSIVKIFNYVNPTAAEPEVVPVNTGAMASTPASAAPAATAAPASANPPVNAPASNDNEGVPQYAPNYDAQSTGPSSSGQQPGSAASD